MPKWRIARVAPRMGYVDPEMVFVRKIEVTTDGDLNTGLRITKTVLTRSEP